MAQEFVRPFAPAGAAPPYARTPAGLAPVSGARLYAAAGPWMARRAEALTAAALLVVALAHLLRIYDRGFNLLDEGFVLHVAERVLQGQVPYRDFFTQLTPGAFLALAGVFAVTGPSVIAGRWVTVALGLLITLLLYRCARRLASRPTAALAALAFPVWGIGQGWFYPNYSWFALAASVGALDCLLCAVSAGTYQGPHVRQQATGRPDHAGRRSNDGAAGFANSHLGTRRSALVPWAAAAGVLCGLAAFCKQNMGLYVLVALLGALLLAGPTGWRRRLLGAAVMAFAALPVPLALVAWLAANGALAAFYRDAVVIPLTVFPREMAAPYPPFWPPWPLPGDPPGQGAWAFRLVCLLPPLPYGLALANLLLTSTIHRRSLAPGRRAACAAWLAFGLAIWATAFPRADFDHVQVALGPAFVIGAAMFESAGRVAARRRVWRLWGAPDGGVQGAACKVQGFGLQGAPAVPPGWRRGAERLDLSAVDGAWCRRWLPQTLAGGLLGGFLVAGLGHARALHMGPGWTLRTLDGVAPRAAGIRLDHDEAAELNRLIAEVRRLSAPGETIAAVPWNAGLYFLAERRNATRYDLFLPASVLPEDLPEIEAALDRARLIVYWTARDAFVNHTSLEDRLPELHRRIASRYRAAAAINAYRLLLRE